MNSKMKRKSTLIMCRVVSYDHAIDSVCVCSGQCRITAALKLRLILSERWRDGAETFDRNIAIAFDSSNTGLQSKKSLTHCCSNIADITRQAHVLS